jgi:ActR/RegA family two-component response regulator
MRLLIVEDRAAIHRHYASALKRIGVAFDIAESKLEAIELLRRRCYEGAIIDLQLSDGDTFAPGKDVLRFANALGEGTSCFVVSGTPYKEDVLESWEAGAFKFIFKSSMDSQDIALKVAEEASKVKVNMLGKFGSLNVYLAHPEMVPQWEYFVHQALECGFEKMQHGLKTAFKDVMPILRLNERSNSLDIDTSRKVVAGTFWSRAVGSAVRVSLAAQADQLPLGQEGQQLTSGHVGNTLFFSVWKLPDVGREQFPEGIDQTPWKSK